jgi:tRNA dimethylallyltransferase
VLYARIDERVDAMIRQGLVGEVQNLLDAGLGPVLETMRVIGYNEIIAHLQDEISLEEAAALIIRNTHAYVRRQANWFKPTDPDIHWLNAQDPALLEKALDLIECNFGIKPER